ncbi:hypothetical protein TNCV_4910001 [Trichonephila clavipes]|nr:hypothetical protein TNCV_4910001 [Trichonephila clavipes]
MSNCVGTRLARASVTETSQFLEISSGTMIKVMTAYTHCSKTSSANENNGLKEKFSERDRRVLKRIATSKMLTTAELYQHLDQGYSTFFLLCRIRMSAISRDPQTFVRNFAQAAS